MSKRLGIIGAGKVGTTLGRLALAAGWQVRISGSPRQPMQALIVSTMLPGAELLPEAEVVAASDVVVLAVPLAKVPSISFGALSGVVVVDATNHWAAVDGTVDGLESAASSSHWVLAHNPAMRLVKSLNHLGYHDMETDARPIGATGRRAVAVASDDAAARAAVVQLVDDLGFDPVPRPFADVALLEEGGPVFGVWVDAADLTRALDAAALAAAAA